MRVYVKNRDIVAESTAAIRERLVKECPMARETSRFKVKHTPLTNTCSMCYVDDAHYEVTEASGKVWNWCGECREAK